MVYSRAIKKVHNLRIEKVFMNTIKAYFPSKPSTPSDIEIAENPTRIRRSLLLNLQPIINNSNSRLQQKH